jgi:hypothetical protein
MWPTIVLDNFFDDPNYIVQYSNSLEYLKEPSGRWPGKRAGIDDELKNAIIEKALSLYLSDSAIVRCNIDATFQKIKRFSKNKEDSINRGFLHKDSSNGNSTIELAGIIYLSENNSNINQGTSFFTLKPGEKYPPNDNLKSDLYLNGNYDKGEFDSFFHQIDKVFYKNLDISNKFNRLIMFDANQWHAANSFYSENNEERLTITFFLSNIVVGKDKKPQHRKNLVKL